MGYPIEQVIEYLQACHKGAIEQGDVDSSFRISLALKVLTIDLSDMYEEEMNKKRKPYDNNQYKTYKHNAQYSSEDSFILTDQYAFMHEVCCILDIDVPDISNYTDSFQTETMLAQYRPSTNTIIMEEVDDFNPDVLFAIAHELRHAWQMKNKKKMFNNYKSADELSVEEYNLQEAELDANAFGTAVMECIFGMKPLFENLPVHIKEKIYELAEKIVID